MVEEPSSQKTVSFAVWYAPGAPDDAMALEALLTKGGAATIQHYSTVDAWMAAKADVLVLRGISERGLSSPIRDTFISAHDFAPLEGRRVLGIGHEAGRVFSALDLDIGGKGGASFRESEPVVVLGDGPSLPGDRVSEHLVAFNASALRDGPEAWDCQGLYLPRLSPVVEPLARWQRNPSHAPIARQGNCIFCGIAADFRTWTPDFEAVFREIAVGLGRDPLRPFALSEWEVTPPGTYSFRLDPGFREGGVWDKEFHFKFCEPVLFSAKLDMKRGGRVRLFFRGQATFRGADGVDTQNGESLHVLMPVTKESVEANRERYWVLGVTNFDVETPAACELQVGYDVNAVLAFPDGLEVAMRSPPRDEEVVKKLIALFRAEDAAVALRAGAALIMVGEPALPLLEAALVGVDGDLRLKIVRIMVGIGRPDIKRRD